MAQDCFENVLKLRVVGQVLTRVRNRAENPIVFRARFFVHIFFQSCTIVHEKCTIFFVLNEKIVQNRANIEFLFLGKKIEYICEIYHELL